MTQLSRSLKFRSRVLLSGKSGFLALATLMMTILNFGLNYILDYALPLTDGVISFVLSHACGILCNMVYYILLAGLGRLYLNVCRKEPARISDLFSFFSGNPEQLAIYSIVPYVFYSASAYVTDWCISGLFGSGSLWLYAVSLIVWMAVYVFFELCVALALYLYCDDPGRSAAGLLADSYRLMRGQKGRLLYLRLSFLGMTALGFLSFGIGFLFVKPYQNLAEALFYLNLTDQVADEAARQP